MKKLNRLTLPIITLLIVTLACSGQTAIVPTTNPNGISTAIGGTVAAALTQTAQVSIPTTGQDTPTPPATDLPAPTATASPTLTPFLSPTPAVPMISVSVATNCRVGPGKQYNRVGALLVDETAEIFAIDPTGNYWYIRNPDVENDFCWLWGEYASIVGNVAALPIFTPPPTPTPAPNMAVSFKKIEVCAPASWWIDLEIKNTGGTTFKSTSITIRDTVTNNVISLTVDGFTDKDGCTNTTVKDNLNPGGAHIISMPPFNYDPTGHKIRATISACAEKGNTGGCVSQVIEFTP